jgi:hypothetical protein
MLSRSLLSVVCLLGMAAYASADPILYVGLQYTTSYDRFGNELGLRPFATTTLGNGTVQTSITLGGGAVYHQFEMFLNVSGLAADQDAATMQYNAVATGGVTFGGPSGAYNASILSQTPINPPKMPSGTGSDALPHSPWFLNFSNVLYGTKKEMAFIHDATRGTTTTGGGNGVYGDYIADMNGATDLSRIHGVGEGEPYDIGVLTVQATTTGGFGYRFFANPDYFYVLGNNVNGLGTPADEFFPTTYIGKGDSVVFVPEPSTLVVLGIGAVSLLLSQGCRRLRYFRTLLCVVCLLGMAAYASATPMLYVGLQYTTSYDADGDDIGPLTSTKTTLGDSTKRTTITLGGNAVYHEFEMYLNISGLAAGQDVESLQYAGVVGGGATLGGPSGAYNASILSQTPIDPPKMPSGTGSDAPPHAPWNLNFMNSNPLSYAFAHDAWRGSTTAGAGNGTFGDYIAYISGSGFGGVGENAPYDIGTLYVTDTAIGGTVGFSFAPNPGYFWVLGNNVNGLGTPTNEFFPTTYIGKGDSVVFVPEPSTLILLGIGAISLYGWAWRRRRVSIQE